MGWNNLEIIKKESKLLQGIKDGSWAYFVHSYLIVPENNSIVSATSQYGVNVPAIVEKGNLYGTQFHPEKSGKLGAIIMKNFLNVCSDQK
jgi:imidazole glycerol-phosphate synthase subunit HisH